MQIHLLICFHVFIFSTRYLLFYHKRILEYEWKGRECQIIHRDSATSAFVPFRRNVSQDLVSVRYSVQSGSKDHFNITSCTSSSTYREPYSKMDSICKIDLCVRLENEFKL